jgi:peptidoglycan glycosyltransferase
VNRQITRMAVVGLVLLAALVVGTTYWQAWAASGLADRQDNSIQQVVQFTVKRGKIYAADGKTVLADNVRRKVAGQTLYLRYYPQHGLAAHIVGYSTRVRSRAGLESSENDFLTGSNTNLSTVLDTAFDKLKGTTVKGNDLHLTLRAGAQRIALNALGGKCGAAVAIEPRTGRLLVSASSPTYDPNLIEGRYNQAAKPKFGCPPFVNRAEAGLYVPGSAFKVITASAALDSGKFTLESRFYDPGYCIEYGQKVSNFADQSGPEVFRSVDFTQALEHSINAVFCEIGKALGARTIMETAKRFGFYSVPPLETPVNERAISGLYNNGKLFLPKDDSQADPGRLAFGQGPGNAEPRVTPIQMAMVAATIANGGLVMRPYVVERVVAPDGSTVTSTKPDSLGRAISENTANDVTTMMEAVVQGGTGTAAQLPGIRVAGKTGTAESGESHVNTTWFICFAPVENPKVAVAVALERQSATGGTTAAPIARTIMEALLR